MPIVNMRDPVGPLRPAPLRKGSKLKNPVMKPPKIQTPQQKNYAHRMADNNATNMSNQARNNAKNKKKNFYPYPGKKKGGINDKGGWGTGGPLG